MVGLVDPSLSINSVIVLFLQEKKKTKTFFKKANQNLFSFNILNYALSLTGVRLIPYVVFSWLGYRIIVFFFFFRKKKKKKNNTKKKKKTNKKKAKYVERTLANQSTPNDVTDGAAADEQQRTRIIAANDAPEIAAALQAALAPPSPDKPGAGVLHD